MDGGRLRNYFAFSEHEARQELRGNRLTALRYVAIAFTLLLFAYIAEPHWADNLFTKISSEGLIIGGWVFLWEAISAVAFENRDVIRRIKEYRCFLKACISFEYEE